MKIYLQKLSLLLLALCILHVLSSAQTLPTPTPSPTPPLTPPTSNSNLTPITGLPGDPQPNLSNLAIPNRPLPSAERVGVDQMNQMSLTLDEAVTLALQNNNDVDNSRIGVKIAEFNLRATLGVYDPTIVSESFYQRATTPTASTIGGAGSSGSVTQTSAVGNIGATGFSPRYGGLYQANFTTSRTTTNNQNATLNPQFPSNFTLTYTQPLWRGRKIDTNRRNIEIAKKNLSLTDAQFRQKVIDVVTQVEQGYWDLVFALRNLQVQNDAVKQAQIQLESNKRLVKQGVLAPIEIVAATAQITTFEQNVYTAQDTVTKAENTLKTLISKERTADIWSRPLTPVTPPELDVPKIPLENAVSDALKNRPELLQLQKTAEINEINTRYLRDQLKPQINFVGTYTSNGLAGIANPVTRTSTTVDSNLLARVNQLSAFQGISPLVIPPVTTVTSPPANLVGGYFGSFSNLFQNNFPTYRAGISISFPFRNKVAEAQLGQNLAQESQIKNQRSQQELLIEADVRNTLQALRSAEAKLASANASRVAAEQLYESEQRQFRAGTTTVYLVFQRQTDLLNAQSRELQAQTDLNKAIANFQRATGNTLTVNNIIVK